VAYRPIEQNLQQRQEAIDELKSGRK